MALGKYPIKTLLWDISRWSVHVFYISIRQIQFGLSYAYSISNFSVLIYVCNNSKSKWIFSITLQYVMKKNISIRNWWYFKFIWNNTDFFFLFFCDHLKILRTSVLFYKLLIISFQFFISRIFWGFWINKVILFYNESWHNILKVYAASKLLCLEIKRNQIRWARRILWKRTLNGARICQTYSYFLQEKETDSWKLSNIYQHDYSILHK